ncbi:hypothetical protein [Albimonas pacifica]|uniref:Uncharacterized protein n=1 Tax=Albimonas pacifica TaxID=1114924 RepID=A0A1I3JI58_9RHOB|nr:hypothetical protein [Albimonas pacifica]SFI59962.1 hypothetical protein SAMN05216258_10819 [Albimonas pacifica]
MKHTRFHDAAPGAGTRRAAVRLQRQRAIWLATPKTSARSRQQRRQAERKARKAKAAALRAAAQKEGRKS